MNKVLVVLFAMAMMATSCGIFRGSVRFDDKGIVVDSLTVKVDRLRQMRTTASRPNARYAPGMLLTSECRDGHFRAYVVPLRDVEGARGSVAITLQVSDLLAGSQLMANTGSPDITNFRSGEKIRVADWWTGRQDVTFFSDDELNAVFGSSPFTGQAFESAVANAQIDGGGGDGTLEFKAGVEYTVFEFDYPESWGDNCITIASGDGGLMGQLGATGDPFLSLLRGFEVFNEVGL